MENNKNKINITKSIKSQIILAVIAILSILFGDFAGWYHGDYYNKIYQEGYIYFGSGFLTTAVMLVIISLLGLTIKLLLELRQDKNMESKKILEKVGNIIMYNSINVTIVIFGAILFMASVIQNDTEEWWLDIAFLVPTVACIIIIILAKKIKAQLTIL